jgi:uncharacterized caspase-like protein
MRLLAVLGLCLFVFSAGGGLAAERRVAMVVGNADYQRAGKLRNPVNDATDIAASLGALGFEVISAIDRDSREFEEDIETFSKAAQNADVALFYYSGHAMQLGGANYLLPIDFDADTELAVKRQAFNLADIVGQMEASAKVSLVFLDACRNNPLADALHASLGSKGRSAELGRGLARVSGSRPDTMIVFATAPGSIAADGAGRNSPFTQAMLRYLPAPGIEIETMMKRVTSAVAIDTGSRQQPERLSKLTIEFYFSPAESETKKGAASPADDRLSVETAFWQAIQSSETAGDYQEYLDGIRAGRFTGLFTALAERRLAALKKPKDEPASFALASPQSKEEQRTGTGSTFADIQSISTRGVNHGVMIDGIVRRTGEKSWHETNTEAVAGFYFKEVEVNETELTLFDESRDIYMKVDIARRLTYWRPGANGAWYQLYAIVDVD